MKCKACDAEVDPASVFCHRCGERIGEGEAGDSSAPKQPAKKETVAERMRGAVSNSNDDDDEEVDLWEGTYSAKDQFGSWVLAGLLSIVLLVAGVVASSVVPIAWLIALILVALIWGWLFLVLLYRKLSVKYELTSQRFIHKSGILTRTTDRIEVIDMDDVTYSQGIIQRIMGVGTVKIVSSDSSHPELLLRGIDNVQEIADLIDDTRRKERRRRGLHIETI